MVTFTDGSACPSIETAQAVRNTPMIAKRFNCLPRSRLMPGVEQTLCQTRPRRSQVRKFLTCNALSPFTVSELIPLRARFGVSRRNMEHLGYHGPPQRPSRAIVASHLLTGPPIHLYKASS